MQFPSLRSAIHQTISRAIIALERSVQQCFRPANPHLVRDTLADIPRSKSELIAENAFLRQQLIVRRQTKRPVLSARDRTILVLLASRFSAWREALMIVKPDSLLGWHRQGFGLCWRHKSKARTPRPRVPEDVIALIHAMALHNRLWGVKRIRDELRKVGYHLTKRTVAKYIHQVRRATPPRQPSQTWGSFLKNHAPEIRACDFLQTYDLWFRTLFVFFIIELGSRRVVHFAVTSHPTDAWVAQQVREATPFDTRPRFLIRDNARKYSTGFERAASGITILRTPIRAPKANAVCERFLGSVRRECLDHVLVFDERHLQGVIKEYIAYFNAARPHQGISGQTPIPSTSADPQSASNSQIVAFPVLGGLHHDYRRVA